MTAVRSYNRRLREERGGVLALAAVSIPVFLLLAGLVIDAGNWFTHKRQLQNRADAGALAAGVEYLSQLAACKTSPVTTGTAIANVAKLYAGTEEAIAGTKYNQQITSQATLNVAINASGYGNADSSDGQNPCVPHTGADPEGISPTGAIWTDVKVRESNIGTLFSSFGLNLPSVSAQARVEVKQIVGIKKHGLPLVNESGDTIECVWAQFVRARDGSTTGFTVTPSNPIPLTRVGTSWTWTSASNVNVTFTNQHDDVAIRYWAGVRDGTTPCSFSTQNKRPLPHWYDRSDPDTSQQETPQQIDWLNVYDTGAAPGTNNAPKLRNFSLGANTCGGPGFLYTTSTDPTVQCQVNFTAVVDSGVNNVNGELIVQPYGSGASPGIAPVTITWDTRGGLPNLATVSGTITVLPNAVRSPAASPAVSQDYTQTGPTWLRVDWRQLSGRVGSGSKGNCATGGSNCSGQFQGETVTGVGGNVQQQFYTDDPLGSTPLVATSLSLPSRSFPALGSTGSFTITFTHTGLDQESIVLMRDSVQNSGNRTRAIWCGGSSGGANEIEEAFVTGCPVPLVVNQRGDSCSTPPGGWTEEPATDPPLDCVQLEQGNKTGPVRDGIEDRFACTANNWVAGGPLPPEGDQRWAYIVLTGFGRVIPAPNNGFLPIEGLIRVYVTGWGGKNFSGTCGFNDPAPRGTDDKGAQIWGHMVDILTLTDEVITGEAVCNLDATLITCKPGLVR